MDLELFIGRAKFVARAQRPAFERFAIRIQSIGGISIFSLALLCNAVISGECLAASNAQNLSSPRIEVRLRTAEALGKARDVGAVKPLLDALATEKIIAVRQYMIRALGYIGDKSAVPPLMKIAQIDPEMGTRTMALSAISSIGEPGAIDQLEKWAMDPAQPPEIRAHCVIIAGHHKGEGALATLRKASGDSSPLVRSEAVRSLAQIHGKPEVKQIIQAAQNDRNGSVKAVADAIAKRKAEKQETW